MVGAGDDAPQMLLLGGVFWHAQWEEVLRHTLNMLERWNVSTDLGGSQDALVFQELEEAAGERGVWDALLNLVAPSLKL